jgi:hypothetical protein
MAVGSRYLVHARHGSVVSSLFLRYAPLSRISRRYQIYNILRVLSVENRINESVQETVNSVHARKVSRSCLYSERDIPFYMYFNSN